MKTTKQIKNRNIENAAYEMTKDQMIREMRKINARHRDNMESRKNALKILMNGIQIGNKVFIWVSLDDSHIDESYQCRVQNHVKTFIQKLDDRKCDQLKINYREEGKFYVWDGQHRVIVMKIKVVDFALCVMIVGLTQEKEAELLGCQGNGIKKPNPYDIFKAAVCVCGKLIRQLRICVISMI